MDSSCLLEWKMINSRPADSVPLFKISHTKYKWWDREEYIQQFLLIAKNDHYHLAFRLALDFGLRIGEIVGLNCNDIDLSLCQIHVHRQWLESEKGFGPTKHGKERFLKYPSNSEIDYLMQNALKGKESDEPLITNLSGGRVNPQKLSRTYFQRVAKAANNPRIRFHDLRHTFASWFMIKNDNIW